MRGGRGVREMEATAENRMGNTLEGIGSYRIGGAYMYARKYAKKVELTPAPPTFPRTGKSCVRFWWGLCKLATSRSHSHI